MYRFLVLFLFAAPLSAQVSHYGHWPVKEPETHKLGIEALSISGEGVRGEPGYVATAEVLGPEEKHLAICELEWHREKVVTCTFEDGEILRVSAFGQAGAVFEDVRTGERVTAQITLPATFGEVQSEPVSKFEGDKTEEEVIRDWGPELEIMSAVTTEVITLLFGSKGLMMDFPGAGAASPPRSVGNAIACPGAHEPICASLPIFVSAGSFTGPNTCCSEISATLDVTCRFYTVGYSCCYQTECNSYCLPLPFICSCNRTGHYEICVECGPNGPLK